jgi:hypothetical protein
MVSLWRSRVWAIKCRGRPRDRPGRRLCQLRNQHPFEVGLKLVIVGGTRAASRVLAVAIVAVLVTPHKPLDDFTREAVEKLHRDRQTQPLKASDPRNIKCGFTVTGQKADTHRADL